MWAPGAGIGTTTVHRYITEAVEILASHAPTFTEAVKTASAKAFVILDGTLLPIDRIAADRPFHSGKHKKHGMNVQIIADPAGRLLWASPALPGAVHDIKAARTHGIIDALDRRGVLGGQGLPRRRRHHTGALPGALGDALRRPASRQPFTREGPRARRAGHGHPQDLAAPAQTALLDHPDHQPREGRPHPAPDLLKLRLERLSGPL